MLFYIFTYLLTHWLTDLLTYWLTDLLTYWLTYLLTSWIRVLEKLTGSQLVKKFPVFYEIRGFIIVFTSARHLSLSLARSIQSMPPSHYLKIHLNIILPSVPWSAKWSVSLRFPHQKPVCASPLPHPCYITSPSHFSLITWIIFGEEYISVSSSLSTFLHSSVTLSLIMPKYSLQHPILKYCQPTFLPQFERPCFTPIRNNRHNFSSRVETVGRTQDKKK